MKFTFRGEPYEIPEPEDLDTVELRRVKQHTGMGLRSYMRGLEDMDGDAIAAMLLVAKQRAGEKVKFSDFDDVKPLKDIEWPEVEDDEEKPGDESNPPTSAPATASPDDGMFPTDE